MEVLAGHRSHVDGRQTRHVSDPARELADIRAWLATALRLTPEELGPAGLTVLSVPPDRELIDEVRRLRAKADAAEGSGVTLRSDVLFRRQSATAGYAVAAYFGRKLWLPDDLPGGEDRAGEPYETGRAADSDPSRVETREDFARFLSALLADFRATGASEWENGTLDRFLDAFAAVAGARAVDAPERQQERASWRLFAEIVQAATGYE